MGRLMFPASLHINTTGISQSIEAVCAFFPQFQNRITDIIIIPDNLICASNGSVIRDLCLSISSDDWAAWSILDELHSASGIGQLSIKHTHTNKKNTQKSH